MKYLLKRVLTAFVPLNVIEFAIFEYKSIIGRFFSKRLHLDKNKKNYINLGSGPLIYNNFINIDFFYTPGIDYGADLRYPLLIDDETINGIFCEHTMEHLTYKQVDALLNECNRILKKDGIIRILVPDVSIFIQNYAANNKKWFDQWEKIMYIDSPDPKRAQRKLISPMSAISFITQEYLHMSCWDFETMKYYLEKNKFKNIIKSHYRKSTDNILNIDLDEEARKYVTLYVEATK